MKITESNFKILQYIVTKTELNIIPKNEKNKELAKIELDLDYNIYKNTDNEIYKIGLILKGTPESKKPGYKFHIESEGYFSMDTDEEDKIIKHLNTSGLGFMINNTRAYLLSITSYAPYGKYKIPSIDVGKLIQAKSKRNKNSGNKKES